MCFLMPILSSHDHGISYDNQIGRCITKPLFRLISFSDPSFFQSTWAVLVLYSWYKVEGKFVKVGRFVMDFGSSASSLSAILSEFAKRRAS